MSSETSERSENPPLFRPSEYVIGFETIGKYHLSPTDHAVPPGQSNLGFVTDQRGRIYVHDEDGFRDDPFLDIRDRIVELRDGHEERGLLGIAFHPDFETNRKLYIRYSAPRREGTPEEFSHTFVLSEFEAADDLSQANPGSERTILEIPEPQFNHNSGEIEFGPDGYLYVAVGDGGGEKADTGIGHAEEGNGQDITENLLGSILRIDVDSEPTESPRTDPDAPVDSDGDERYAIPADNPLVDEDGLDEQYAWGFRNIWGMSFDSEGRLFASSVGEQLFESVHLVEEGGNHGWRIKEGTHCFNPENPAKPLDNCPDESKRGEPLIDPIVEYPQTSGDEKIGNAVVGGFVYEGDEIPELQGKYVFGDLTKQYDMPRGRLFAATPPEDGEGRWDIETVGIEGNDSDYLDGYLFTLGRDADGELYALTSSHLSPVEESTGAVHRVVPAEASTVEQPAYGWVDARSDAYWYSLYNMNNAFVRSGNGITFPFDEDQFEALPKDIAAILKGLMQRMMLVKRQRSMLKHADVGELPIENPNLLVAPFTTGDPQFTQEPDLGWDEPDGKPDASTLAWDREQSSQIVSPAALAWTHLKGLTWAKHFESEFDLTPTDMATKVRAQVLGTAAQLGIKFALENERLLLNPGDPGDMRLVAEYRPATGEIVDDTPRPMDHAAMLWFLSDMVSFARGGWFGYVNPDPMLEMDELQRLADDLAVTTIDYFPAEEIVDAGSTRDLGVMLGAAGWYGTHAGDVGLVDEAAEYAAELADAVDSALGADGRVENGTRNQAATQGVIGQGLLWASQIDGVDRTAAAERVLGYLRDELWDEDAGTFASGVDDATYPLTTRDAGDITGGVNAADELLGMEVQGQFAQFFDNAFNRGHLQRAERRESHDPSMEYPLPLSPDAGEQSSPSPASQSQQDTGGEHGQAAVYNAAVEHDTTADEWRVTDDRFVTDGAMYLANQDVWLGLWGGSEYPGRGVPGRSDEPPE